MKIRTLSESQARKVWARMLDLSLRGYCFFIKRRGKVVARFSRLRPTMAAVAKVKKN